MIQQVKVAAVNFVTREKRSTNALVKMDFCWEMTKELVIKVRALSSCMCMLAQIVKISLGGIMYLLILFFILSTSL